MNTDGPGGGYAAFRGGDERVPDIRAEKERGVEGARVRDSAACFAGLPEDLAGLLGRLARELEACYGGRYRGLVLHGS